MDLPRPVRACSLCMALFALACAGSNESSQAASPAPWPVTAFPELPEVMLDVPESRIELGRMLFYDTLLSVDHETACVTCHSELWGMSDTLPRAVGHGAGLNAGPQRMGDNQSRRNSLALFNLAFRESFLWDGREASLEDQALVPLVAADEMGNDLATVLAEIEAIPEYVELFGEAFPNDPRVSEDNLAAAFAAFQRTFISDRAAYDAYLEGRPELLTEEELDGMQRFADFGCHDCHVPPLFESEVFANRNAPEVDGIVDHGLEEITGQPEDRGKFRTPTLRNFRATGPYFHNGSVSIMDDAVRHELEQSGLPFTAEDVHLITQFIDHTLFDDSEKPLRPVSVPSGLPLTIDPGRPSLN